jgi:predicted HAD superfamily Cof-like phosphohydrolase
MSTKSNFAIEFRKAFGQPVYGPFNVARAMLQSRLIGEEAAEFSAANHLACEELTNKQAKADALKELADLVYVCYQYAAAVGWDLDIAYNRVHFSNMSKLGPDGKPIYREDGKVLKGPNYKEPSLTDLV